jgi:hypothetical protein
VTTVIINWINKLLSKIGWGIVDIQTQQRLETETESTRAANKHLLDDQAKMVVMNEHLRDDQAKIRAMNERLLDDQAKMMVTNEHLRDDQAKIRAMNERLLDDQAKVMVTNERLRDDQAKINAISERLRSDHVKFEYYSERERQYAAVIYRRDDQPAQDHFRKLVRRLTPVGVKSLPKIRVGRMGDGGYVMIDDFKNAKVAFSFGIGTDASWDLAIADRGIKVVQYDASVEASPQPHENFLFYRKYIGAVASPTADTVAYVLKKHGAPGRSNILKMDIEFAEWEVLDAVALEDLDRFSQIVCEFHGFQGIAYDAELYARADRVLSKLQSLFEVVHVHGTNQGRLAILSNMAFPTELEVTLMNKANCEFELADEIYPTKLDAPGDPNFADIFLGSFKF